MSRKITCFNSIADINLRSPSQVHQEWEGRTPNTFVYQLTAVAPFELTVVFEVGFQHPARQSLSTLYGAPFRERFDALRAAFDARFERTFGLKLRGYSPEEVRTAYTNTNSALFTFLQTLSTCSDEHFRKKFRNLL